MKGTFSFSQLLVFVTARLYNDMSGGHCSLDVSKMSSSFVFLYSMDIDLIMPCIHRLWHLSAPSRCFYRSVHAGSLHVLFVPFVTFLI